MSAPGAHSSKYGVCFLIYWNYLWNFKVFYETTFSKHIFQNKRYISTLYFGTFAGMEPLVGGFLTFSFNISFLWTSFHIWEEFKYLLNTTEIVNPSHPDPGRRENINLKFCFHTSLSYLKRFYQGFKLSCPDPGRRQN